MNPYCTSQTPNLWWGEKHKVGLRWPVARVRVVIRKVNFVNNITCRVKVELDVHEEARALEGEGIRCDY